MLPHAVAYNAPFASSAMAKVKSSLGIPASSSTTVSQALYDLAQSLNAPTSLRELGMREEDLERVAEIAIERPYPNPAPLDKEKLLGVLRDAWEGRRPA